MSIEKDGIKFYSHKKRNTVIVALLLVAQLTLSFFLYISLAANIVWPEGLKAAVGVSNTISYEGRLTDSSGNPLGGTGEPYCFRFSIYDASTGGSKLWPAGTPTNTKATTTDGVFNAIVGSADALTYNFYDSDTVYLNVDVNTATSTCAGSWESLSPRQSISASGYSIASENVYGDLLRTNNSSGIVQIGTGGGVASPIFLGLDVKNGNDYVGQSCSASGIMWYNSTISKALVCEGGFIQAISNTTATGTLAAINTNSGTAATSGTINFSNSNGVSFGINGQTITASVAAAGGGVTLSNFQWPPGQASTFGAYSNATLSFIPFWLDQNMTATKAMLLASHSIGTNTSGTTTGTWSMSVGIYTRNVSTLSLMSSGSQSYAISNTSNGSTSVYVGLRRFSIPININATPGEYWYAVWIRSSGNAQSMSIVHGAAITNLLSGNFGSATNSSWQIRPGLGIYSNASITTAMPSSAAISNIQGGAAAGLSREPWILFTNFQP